MEQKTLADEHALLHTAFARFAEASTRLEQRYEMLCKEAGELRRQLEVKEQLIKQSERLATLGRTAAALAHEVRNPLGAIRLYVSMLKSETGTNESCQDLIRNIEQGIDTLNGVVTNILQFSKRDEIERSPVNIAAIIREQIALVEASEGCTLSTRLELSPARFILGDAQRLRRMFFNLLMNALQAGGKGIMISIRESLTSEGNLALEIEDTGPGVPEQLLETLFDPFITGRTEGTGLGLAVVRLIAEQHGGTITVSNRPGACFRIVFPLNMNLFHREQRQGGYGDGKPGKLTEVRARTCGSGARLSAGAE